MSYDLAVWYPHERLDGAAATKVYAALCDGKPTSLRDHPAVQAFYDELYAAHPELDDVPEDRVDDHDYCPWSCAHDRSGAHIVMSCIYSQSDNVFELVRRLAERHGLALYDPQSGSILYPGEPEQAARKPWWKLW
jgi:hypothetical protein